ncbi:zinc-binding dehydrogenase [Roseovarius sp. SCSIO 43702]|uniref:zinc-binding dehydrogenase n=1 Tax=Roseovarius sp. SCSIO 43702 TaxID=2823043 RepID=UPI001C738AF9|nr:zinc-binding dehydrogenase [Roseovarius sp. SCSIO 43702]QYX56727.1 zinc-binding dehydrogenase [Roseovarius sp. SCSIO 43702]
MRAAIHESFGEPTEVLACKTTDRPEPGQGQVLVRMGFAPIHNHDLWTVRGTYGVTPDLPAIGGSEAMGVVEAAGEGVDDAMVGQRISAAGIRGAWAEYFVAEADGVLPLPDSIPDEAGAQLIAMPLSALALLEMLKAEKGDWIVQTAANGAVGKLMVTLARSRGVNLVNLVRREGAAEEMREVEAENVIDTSEDGWKTRVRELTGKAGAVSAIDAVGGQTGADLIDLLGENGELVVFGTATGEPMPIASGPMIFKQLTIRGFWAARLGQHMSDTQREKMIGELVSLAAQGDLPLDVGETHALDDVTKAMSAAQESGRGGKILLRP